MIEHAGGKAGFFQLAVTKHSAPIQRRSASSGRIGRPPSTMPALAALSAMVSKIFRVDLVCGIDPLDPGVQDFQRRHHEIGGVEHVEHGAAGAGKPLLHHKGEFGLDPCGDEAVRRHQAAIGKEHVVEQHAGIRLVDIERALHRLRGQADLVALDDAALRRP